MRKSDQPAFHPVSKLKVAKVGGQSVVLQSGTETIEISVLAEDLFRLRIARGKRLSRQPSWAVTKTDWAAVPVGVKQTARQVMLETPHGKLALRLADGSWELTDAEGRAMFSAKAGASGFAEE